MGERGWREGLMLKDEEMFRVVRHALARRFGLESLRIRACDLIRLHCAVYYLCSSCRRGFWSVPYVRYRDMEQADTIPDSSKSTEIENRLPFRRVLGRSERPMK